MDWILENWDEEDWMANSLKRLNNKKSARMNVRKTKKTIKAMALAKSAAAANSGEASTGKDFATGIAAGAGVGAIGLLAAFIALRACQRKNNNGDNFERLLQ